eukprot:gene802-1282_t
MVPAQRLDRVRTLCLLNGGEPVPIHLQLHQRQFHEDGAMREKHGNISRPGLHPHVDYLARTKTGNAVVSYHFHHSLVVRLPQEDAKWRYSSCALVSNSGELLSKRMGEEIDSHDAVIRMNFPPVKGFEPFVGSKTTFDFTNHGD